jgi:hypothetical protein
MMFGVAFAAQSKPVLFEHENSRMPYFVFRINPDKQLKLVNTFTSYKEAKDLCRELRIAGSPDNPNAVRMAFAEDEGKAKRLLAEKRQPSSPLEEWEA